MTSPILSVSRLGFPWETQDPFLFCVYHNDAYPEGNAQLGPNASLRGRNIGQDFEGIDGWRMYHGDIVPGFPQHPHRGFETVTIVRKGFVDHSDSLGATARFGQGDTQWLTAGRGIVHSEMFPLLETTKPNPLELFQIWLNLPKSNKMADPHFSMLWSHTIPQIVVRDEQKTETEISVIAGSIGEVKAPPPPPNSWAADPANHVAIWTIKLPPGAQWTLPAVVSTDQNATTAQEKVNRSVYFFAGEKISIADRTLETHAHVRVRASVAIEVKNTGKTLCELLVLQGKPIAEPVVQYGPFVMNTRTEIQQAYSDYQRTRFGGWPWNSDGPVHDRSDGRFAKHIDGRVEKL